jgi:ABC-type nitrate/sulfonate/bicarbonate transport system permease component
VTSGTGTTSARPSIPAAATIAAAQDVVAAEDAGVLAARRARRTPTARVVAWRVLRWVLHTVWPLALVYVAWTAWVDLKNLPPAVAPHPNDVLRFIADNPGSFLGDAWNTILVVVGGLLVGAVAGAVLAGASWYSSLARSVISGPALITQCLPIATIAPVLARVFGYNQRTIVVIAALIAFFPVLVFTTAGLRQTPPGADDLFVVLGGTRWQRFWRLAVPSALPRLLVAMRLSVVAAVVGAMLAQWIMGTSGLGYRLVIAQASFRTNEAWGASLVAIVLSVLLYSIVSALCRVASDRFE